MSGDDKAIIQAVDHLDAAQRRVLVDLLLSGSAATWERRAVALENARPRPEDYRGAASVEQLRAQWHRLTEAARACRARAQVSPLELVTEDVETVLEEAS